MGEGTDQVRPAHDTDDPAIAHDGYVPDSVLDHQLGQFRQRCLLGCGHDMSLHDLGCGTMIAADVVEECRRQILTFGQ